MVEKWEDIQSFEGYYQVSNKGRVRSLDRLSCGRRQTGRVMVPGKGKTGYLFYGFRCGGKKHQEYVHRLVAKAFLGGIPDGHNVNHKDGDKSNNTIENLEVVTFSENTRHAYTTGLFKNWLRPVFGYKKKSGYIVGEFPSMVEAANATGMSKSDVSKACWKGGEYSGKGIVWNYLGSIKEEEFVK